MIKYTIKEISMIDINAVRTDPNLAKVVQAAFRRAVGMINGRWKLEILWLLSHGTRRFGELKRGVPGITQHMLTAQLRALERDGLIKRPIFVEIVKWAEEHERLGAWSEPDLQASEHA